MKKIAKLFGIIALVAVIAFSMAACGDPDDENNGNGNGNGNGGGGVGDTSAPTPEGKYYHEDNLVLSGQVYLEDYYTGSYTPFNDDLEIRNVHGGSGQVTGGMLSYSIGVPPYLIPLNDYFEGLFDDYEDLTVSREANSYLVENLPISTLYYGSLKRVKVIIGEKYSSEQVFYLYVDNDVTISGKGWTVTEKEGGMTITGTLGNLNLQLKEGWNTVYSKVILEETNATTGKYTKNVLLSNPASLMWVIQ
jgi:hypothetical protein